MRPFMVSEYQLFYEARFILYCLGRMALACRVQAGISTGVHMVCVFVGVWVCVCVCVCVATANKLAIVSRKR